MRYVFFWAGISVIAIGISLSVAMVWVFTGSTELRSLTRHENALICCDGTNVLPMPARLSWTNYSSIVPPSEQPRLGRLLVLQRIRKTMSTAFTGEARQALVCATVAPRSSLNSHPDT